ncbi:hypothetical protein ACEWY4_004659 [Coilia grayii]|uniref:Fibronectin type-III domain-containing protein n=1 Tax=Coilia grayii TaxID=363190 RepID=A0ABD1KMA2_9TELE
MARFALVCLLCATVNEVTWCTRGTECLNQWKAPKERAFYSNPGEILWHSTNISCVTYLTYLPNHHVTCAWKPSENSDNTAYLVTVTRKQNGKYTRNQSYTTRDVFCSFPVPGMSDKVTVVVTSSTNKTWRIHFDDMFATVKYNPPKDLRAEIYSGGIQVKWKKPDSPSNLACEVQDLQEASGIKRVWNCSQCVGPVSITNVRPCSNHTLSVRCQDGKRMSPWSEWSPAVATFFPLNGPISVRLWRRVLKPNDEGKRVVHLMWKGPPQSCGIDEYQVFVDSKPSKRLEPSLEQASVYVTAAGHEVTIAAYKDKQFIPENASVVIPDLAHEGPPVQSAQATAIDGQVLVSWEAPPSAVTSYVVEWHTNQGNYMWQETGDTNLSFYGLPHTLYTITITPLYGSVPGDDSVLHAYAVEGEPARVSAVAVTDIDDTWARVEWDAVPPDQCCGFILDYTVFYAADDTQQPKLNVTVINKNMEPGERHFVILKDLQPSTEYSVYVMASSIGGSSRSTSNAFKTRPFGRSFIMKLVLTAVVVLVLLISILSMLICLKKTMFHKLPNPRLSSVGKWTHEDPKKSSSPWGVCQPSDQSMACDISALEHILPCHSDAGESQPFVPPTCLEWTDDYESVPAACTISPQTGSSAPPTDAPADGVEANNGRPQDLVLGSHSDEPHLEHVQSYISVETGQTLAHTPVTLGSSLENQSTKQEPGEQSTLFNELSYITVTQCRPSKVES